jgi:hypothetical protein
MLSFIISYWDIIKFPYFADTIERGDRGWKQAQREGDFPNNSNVPSRYTKKFLLVLYMKRKPREKEKNPHITNSILKRREGRQWHYQQLRMLVLTVVGLLLFFILENHNWNLAANVLKCSFTLSEQTSTVSCDFLMKICIALSKKS